MYIDSECAVNKHKKCTLRVLFLHVYLCAGLIVIVCIFYSIFFFMTIYLNMIF